MSSYIFLFFIICFLPHDLITASQMLTKGNSHKAIVFQPQFKWKDGLTSQQGTGSFIRAPNGKIIGLTSAHFINFSGPQLLKVNWLDIKTKKIIATSVKSWGMPGHEGSYEPLDLSLDYLLLLVEGDIDSQSILEMDSRSNIAVGERIWFPNKDAQAKEGYDLIEGKVSKTNPAYIFVKLDKKIDLQSRSGTPIISQSTGKVIGILTGCDNTDKTLLYLAPGFSIYNALSKTQQSLLLQDVVGTTVPHQ
jgi:hypothetical protein